MQHASPPRNWEFQRCRCWLDFQRNCGVSLHLLFSINEIVNFTSIPASFACLLPFFRTRKELFFSFAFLNPLKHSTDGFAVFFTLPLVLNATRVANRAVNVDAGASAGLDFTPPAELGSGISCPHCGQYLIKIPLKSCSATTAFEIRIHESRQSAWSLACLQPRWGWVLKVHN